LDNANRPNGHYGWIAFWGGLLCLEAIMKRPVQCRNCDHQSNGIIERHLPAGGEKLWRYMSIEKFIHLVLHRYLFVPRIATFDDKREGRMIEQIFNRYFPTGKSPAVNAFKTASERFYSLCFHAMDHENELMWRSYAPNGGVAIVTSTEKLLQARFDLDDTQSNCTDFYFLKVLYGNEFTGRFHPIAVKQLEYQQESEYRLIFGIKSHFVKRNLAGVYSSILPGLHLHFGGPLSDIVDEIWISPNQSFIIEDIVRRILGLSGHRENLQILKSNIQR
jgi:hypothetical protein